MGVSKEVGLGQERGHRLLTFQSVPSARARISGPESLRRMWPRSGSGPSLATPADLGGERGARFPTAPSRAQGPEKRPRRGRASRWPAPLRPTHGVPSPPLLLREKRPRAALLAVGRAGAAEAERGGRRTRCERGRSGPRRWCWGRWRAAASEVSEAPGGGLAALPSSALRISPQPSLQT